MKRLWIFGGCLFLAVVCFALLYIVAADYSDGVASGTYHFAQYGETSTPVLKPNHTFQQELSERGDVRRATGTWRRIGAGGIAFSREFRPVSGQEPGADGTAYADMRKDFGFQVTLILRQYHVLWYGRVDPSPTNSVSGSYAGDEPGVSATSTLKPDHSFEQVIHTLSVTKQAKGSWSASQNGDISFSKDFLKTSGEALRSDETASAWGP